MNKNKFEINGLQTKVIHSAEGQNQTQAIASPIWQTASFRADSNEHFVELASSVKPTEFYTRYGNPTHEQAEAVMCVLEKGEAAHVTASGMGAIFLSVMCLLEKDDHVVAQQNLYGGTAAFFSDVLPRWGIECTFVEQTETKSFAEAIRPNTKLIYVETPSNPLMQLTDLRAVAEIAKQQGIMTIADNTFATPVNQRPLEMGIDAVVHSATKYLGGHHDLTAGVIVGTKDFIDRAWRLHIIAGSVLSPFDGWLLLRGLRTLGLRVERHNQNALALAQFLEQHPKVECVHYPGLESHSQHDLARSQMNGFTGILSVELKGGLEVAKHFTDSLKLAVCAASAGGFETLIVYPAAMWNKTLTAEQRRAMGVNESLVRISVGLEDELDLIADFERALEE